MWTVWGTPICTLHIVQIKMAQDMDVHYIYNNGTECEMQFKKGKQRETREKKDTELKNNAKKCSENENK